MISILWKEIASLNISKNQNQYKTNYSKLGQQFIAGFYPNHTTSFYYFGVVSTWIIWAIVGPQTTTFSLTTQNTRIAATAVYSHTEGRRLHSRIIFLVTLQCSNIWSSHHQHSSSPIFKSNYRHPLGSEVLQCTDWLSQCIGNIWKWKYSNRVSVVDSFQSQKTISLHDAGHLGSEQILNGRMSFICGCLCSVIIHL